MQTYQKQNDIREILDKIGINSIRYKNIGNEILCYCPFHDDKHAGSFFISSKTGQYICFVCNAKGGIKSLVSKLGKSKLVIFSGGKRYLPRISFDQFDKLEHAIPKGSFFENRGITEDEIIKWNIRFSGSSYVFPVYDKYGKLVGVVNRNFDGFEPKYVNSVGFDRKGYLYGENFARVKSRGIIVVEGITDCISMHRFGYSNTVSTMGTMVTINQIMRMNMLSNSITILFDNDDAGKEATLSLGKRLDGEVFVPRFEIEEDKINYIDYIEKDPGESGVGEIRNILKNRVTFSSLLHELVDNIGV